MNWLCNFKVSTRIFTAVIISVIIGVVIGHSINGVFNNTASILTVMIGIALLITIIGFFTVSIHKPFKELYDKFEKLQKGELDISIKYISNDEIGNLDKMFISILQTIKSFNKEVDSLGKAIDTGDLTVRMNTAPFKGCWAEMAKEFNKNVDTIATPMNEAMESLINETNKISKAVNEGKLDIRGNADIFEGEYKEIVIGINNMLDAAAKPINEADQILTRMALNDYTLSMNTDYKGNFSVLANTINDVQKRLLRLQEVAVQIANGDISELENFRKIGKRSENDHIVPAFTNMMEAIKNLIDETKMLASAAIEGNLDARGDAGRFKGEYTSIVKGVNETLDAVVKPMKEVIDVMSQISIGNLNVTVKGNYKGDYAKLTNAVNSTVEILNHVIDEIGNILSEIAQGNLNIMKVREFKGNFATISDSLNKIINFLNQTLDDINSAAEQVAGGARQVSATSQILSQGSTEQASSIEEVTSSITQIAAQTKQNAENANQANELSLSAKEVAVQGNSHMQEMVKAMAEINDSSASISKIIKVIDEIAFQTNILALNAAVEAARAGQHGKGFAVVAEEVRNLAARSANAAKETTDMIEGSIKKVEVGTRIANDTAEALNKIVDSVAKAAIIVGDIASASNEQATGISQINQAISQVAQVVQTNSATAEESASASEELSSQADLLKISVGQFKIKKIKNSLNPEGGLNSDMIRMIEDIMDKKKPNYHMERLNSTEAASAKESVSKAKISLEDNNYGKY